VPFVFCDEVVRRVLEKVQLQLELQLADREVGTSLSTTMPACSPRAAIYKLYGARPMSR